MINCQNEKPMTNGEEQALAIADKYKGNITTEEKIKWLATEVVEVGMAFQSENEEHLLEELGDCAFLLSHIISRYDKRKLGIIHYITLASEKMVRRNTKPEWKQTK